MLILPVGATLSSGSLEIRIGDMGDGTSSTVSWTVVFGKSGSQILRVEASGYDSDGNPCKVSGSVTVVVNEPPDFTISVSPSSLSIRQGESATASISIASVGGFSDPVSLTATGQPSGITVSFAPSTVTPPKGSSASSEISVKVESSVGTGSRSITISGRSGILSRSTILTVAVTPKPGPCLIATAVYDSELTSELSFLRAFRDNVVLSTFAGGSFMRLFDRWYYSFSPQLARLVSENQCLKSMVRVSLYPLLGALGGASGIHSAITLNSELTTVLAGLAAAAWVGLVYTFPSMILISTLASIRARRKQSRMRANSSHLKLGHVYSPESTT